MHRQLFTLCILMPLAAFGQGTHRGITGAPYSAEETTERVQTLADGTHITHQAMKAKIYRDSEGRTRTERPMFMGDRWQMPAGDEEPPVMVMIHDPVANVMYTLNSKEKVARKHSLEMPENQPARAASRSFLFAPPPPPPAPTERSKSTSSTEKLSSETMEGLLVEGTRRTTVWPVGSRGNDRPITEITERWFAPDLGVEVMSKRTDPVNGDTTRKLTNIIRAEPDPSLFQPPADYTVVSQDNPATAAADGPSHPPSAP